MDAASGTNFVPLAVDRETSIDGLYFMEAFDPDPSEKLGPFLIPAPLAMIDCHVALFNLNHICCIILKSVRLSQMYVIGVGELFFQPRNLLNEIQHLILDLSTIKWLPK